MYYTNEFIDDLITQISMAGGDKYVKIQSPNVAKMLDADKLEYKKFGVYWWAVKEGLRTCVHNGEWYCGDIEDSLMKERAWHGDLFRTMLAGMYYMNQQIVRTSGHAWTDKEDNEHDYTLFDEEAGC